MLSSEEERFSLVFPEGRDDDEEVGAMEDPCFKAEGHWFCCRA